MTFTPNPPPDTQLPSTSPQFPLPLRFALATCFSLLTAISAFGHGDVHVQIDALTPQIQKAPSAELYLKRGELYRLDEGFTAALADFERAEKLDPSLETVRFCRGRVLFEAGDCKQAITALDAFLNEKPGHIEGHMVRGRAHARLKEYSAALEDYNRIVTLIDKPTPDCFLERAEVLVALGRGDAAVKSLDEGIARLGNLLSLQKAAVDLEVTMKRHQEALARVDQIMATLQRKEVWQTRRGEILDADGRHDDALQAYREALASLEQLPPHHRKAKPTRELTALLLERVGNYSAQDTTKKDTN